MNKQRLTDIDHHPYPNLWPARGKRHASSADRIGRRHYARQSNPAPGIDKKNLAIILIWGLVLLQMMCLMVALLILAPTEPQASNQTVVESLDESPAARAQPVLPEPSPTPTNTPPPQIPDSQSPQNVAPAELVVEATTPPPQLKPAALRLRGMEITQGIQVFNCRKISFVNRIPTSPITFSAITQFPWSPAAIPWSEFIRPAAVIAPPRKSSSNCACAKTVKSRPV